MALRRGLVEGGQPGQPGEQVLGHAEVAEERLAVGGEEDVGRLDVAVEHAPAVGRAEGVGDAGQDGDGLARGQPAPLDQEVVERAAPGQRHDDGDAVAVVEHVDHPDDVGVVELGQDRRLPPQPVAPCRPRRSARARLTATTWASAPSRVACQTEPVVPRPTRASRR